MRTRSLASIPAALVAAVLILVAVPGAAQDAEEFPVAEGQAPLSGTTRGDGTIVLDDASFCRYLLTAALGDERLTYVSLLDRSKKQRKARNAAFDAGSDERALAGCTAALAAYGDVSAEGDLPGWAQRAPVVPASIAELLPPDFVAEPLAQPEAIGPAARTSGVGDLVSAPFSVTPGPWLAELDAVECEAWSGSLRDARDPARAFALEDSREYFYELDGGHYYWDVEASDCAWSVDLAPVVLGPDPTPTPEPRAVVPALHGPEWNRYPDAKNPDFLTAALARQAVLDAELVPGSCTEESGKRRDRVWRQDPPAGSLVGFGSPVDIWIANDCDIYLGDRIELE